MQGVIGRQEEGYGTILCSVLQIKSGCWTESYKYVKRRKGNRESIPADKDQNGHLVRDPIEKTKSLNPYYYVSLLI